MPSEIVVVPAGQVCRVSLNVDANGNDDYQYGTTVATVTNSILDVEIGRVTDGNIFQLNEGTYEIEWGANQCGRTVSITSDCVQITEAALVSCGSTPDIAGVINDTLDTILPLAEPWPVDFYSDGSQSEFSGFPWEVTGPDNLSAAGMFFTARPNPPVLSDPTCQQIIVDSVSYTLEYEQFTDQDPTPQDLGDIIALIADGSTSLDTSGFTTDPETTVNDIGNFVFAVTALNDPASYTVTLTNASQYTIDQVLLFNFGLAVERQNSYRINNITRQINYRIVSICEQPAMQTLDCNSAAALAQLGNILQAVQEVEVNVGDVDNSVGEVNTNLGNVESILQSLNQSIQAQVQPVVMGDVCVSVDGGESQYATPMILVNQTTGVVGATQWLDQTGQPIDGVVTVSDPCDCPCEECEDFSLTPTIQDIDASDSFDFTVSSAASDLCDSPICSVVGNSGPITVTDNGDCTFSILAGGVLSSTPYTFTYSVECDGVVIQSTVSGNVNPGFIGPQ